MAQPLALLVEDDSSIQESMRLFLEEEGFRVEAYPNGRAALDWLQQSAEMPKVIFLDLMMPVMNGYQFREEQIKDSRLRAIPVVAFSADFRVEQKVKSMGIEHFLKKPLELSQLLDLIEAYR